jgi:hypothetical protein
MIDMVPQQMVDEAYRAFDRWKDEHDPEGEMEILDATLAYAEYAAKHGIAKYLDGASDTNGERNAG